MTPSAKWGYGRAVSAPEQPVDIRLTLSREDLVSFLERLASDGDLRTEFERSPRDVLARHGIEVNPAEAIPSTATAPDPESLERAVRELKAEPEWPYIFWWWWPYVGLIRPSGEGEAPAAS